jgi:hypothetical protein
MRTARYPLNRNPRRDTFAATAEEFFEFGRCGPSRRDGGARRPAPAGQCDALRGPISASPKTRATPVQAIGSRVTGRGSRPVAPRPAAGYPRPAPPPPPGRSTLSPDGSPRPPGQAHRQASAGRVRPAHPGTTRSPDRHPSRRPSTAHRCRRPVGHLVARR